MNQLHGKTVFTASADSVEITYLPGGGYKYKIDGHYSVARYHNIASAKFDSRRTQVLHDDGRIEPLESAKQFGRM